LKQKTRRVGRPNLPKGQAKGRIVPVRFNGGDLKAIAAAAKRKGQTISEWIRRTVSAEIEA
jgi:hypothetical protein